MARLHSFITLVCILSHSFAMPLADDDNDNDGCEWDAPQPAQLVASATPVVYIPDSPLADILTPYQHPPTPHPSPSQHLHATLPVAHRSQTPAILGTVIGVLIALVALAIIVRGRRGTTDPFMDPPKHTFSPFCIRRTTPSKKRLSDESWVSPILPAPGSPSSPLSQDLELRQYTVPQRKLVPITTPVCTPSDTEFGPRLEFASGDPDSVIHVPLVRVPSPVYIPPFSPSPSLSPSSSSLSPAPSTEPLTSPPSNSARLSCLLSSTFRDTRVATTSARPTTTHLIQTARSHAYAYHPSSVTTTSVYSIPTPTARSSGTRARTGFYPDPMDDADTAWGRVRDTFSTMTTSDSDMACTVPHLLRAVTGARPSTSPFADPDCVNGSEKPAGASLVQSASTEGQGRTQTIAGMSFGLKLRLSDASEHARYRLRERERERERRQLGERRKEREREERERERVAQRFSIESQTSAATVMSVDTARAGRPRSRSLDAAVVRKEFKLRDSESVLREIGW